ncbi:helix-turn-helix transcriptional regulator [Mycobacterium palustre]|nr:helix-turn-helix transcriptional regulator [Mycobacterium palustre]
MKRLREERGLPYAELSRRLADIGREIPPLGLRRIESGERRVDADDLMALAVALGVSPISLLMPASETGERIVEVTGVDGGVECRRLWRWLQAETPLLDEKTASARDGARGAFIAFVVRALPSWRLDEITLVESGVEPHVRQFVRDRDED